MRRLALAAVLAVGLMACRDDPPPLETPAPTTATDVEVTDPGADGTTVEETGGACAALVRSYYDALGAEGPRSFLQPLYDDVTDRLPEDVRQDWQLAAEALITYEDLAFQVPFGDDQLADPDVRAAYEEASGEGVQAALAAVREAIDGECPGLLD